MSIKSTLINGTLVSSYTTIFISLIQLLLVPLLINNLGVYEFGLIGILNIFSLNGYLSIFDLGLASSVQRYVSKYWAEQNVRAVKSLISSTFMLLLIVGTSLGIIVYLMSSYMAISFFNITEEYSYKFTTALQIFAFSYVFQFPALILQNSLLGLLKFKQAKFIICLIEISKLIGVYLVLISGGNFLSVIFLYVFLHFLYFLLSMLAVLIHLKYFNIFRVSKDSLWEIKTFTSFQISGKFTSLLFNQSDRLFIGFFLSPSAMSSFEVMMKIPSLANKFLGLSMSAIVPVIGSIDHNENRNMIRVLYERGFKYYSLFIVPIITLFYFIIPDFILLWVGDEFLFLVSFIRLLLIWSLISVFAFGSNILIGLNLGMSELLRYRVFQTIIKIVSLYVLIKTSGLIAVPLSFILSMLPLIYLLKIFHQILKIDLIESIKNFGKYLLISVLIIYCLKTLLSFTWYNSIIKLGCCSFFILCIVWTLSILIWFSKEDKKNLLSEFFKLNIYAKKQ